MLTWVEKFYLETSDPSLKLREKYLFCDVKEHLETNTFKHHCLSVPQVTAEYDNRTENYAQ